MIVRKHIVLNIMTGVQRRLKVAITRCVEDVARTMKTALNTTSTCAGVEYIRYSDVSDSGSAANIRFMVVNMYEGNGARRGQTKSL